ncbi:MAG: radical SAM protein [Cyclobacteriaceae bacterium]|nr:radical SAM protein [Cyclobacteriaceae bacterium]
MEILALLESIYKEALRHERIDGLVIGTRPDCVDDDILDMIGEIAKRAFVSIEYGLESTIDRTLDRINRQHSFAESVAAIQKTKARNIHIGCAFDPGLPGEIGG